MCHIPHSISCSTCSTCSTCSMFHIPHSTKMFHIPLEWENCSPTTVKIRPPVPSKRRSIVERDTVDERLQLPNVDAGRSIAQAVRPTPLSSITPTAAPRKIKTASPENLNTGLCDVSIRQPAHATLYVTGDRVNSLYKQPLNSSSDSKSPMFSAGANPSKYSPSVDVSKQNTEYRRLTEGNHKFLEELKGELLHTLLRIFVSHI